MVVRQSSTRLAPERPAREEPAPAAPRPGLRERHRLLTEAELEAAALRLFSERGFDAVTVDDIAAEADVSRRTFFRYFDSKEDVLLVDHHRNLAKLREAMAARPVDEPPLAAVRAAVMSLSTGWDEAESQRRLARGRLMLETPSLQARSLLFIRMWEQALGEMIASRLRVDAAGDLRPAVLGAAAVAAWRVAYHKWYADGGRAHLPTLTAEALDLLADGLSDLR